MWRPITAVAGKELREIVRDRRSLGSALFYAVWGPCVMAIALAAIARTRSGDTPLTLTVQGQTNAPALISFLRERSVAIMPDEAAAPRVRAHEQPVALVVEADYPDAFEREYDPGAGLRFNAWVVEGGN